MLEAVAKHLLITELARGFQRAVNFDLYQVLEVVFGADPPVLAQHDQQQIEGADDRHRFERIALQPADFRREKPAGGQARQP
ncbi:hypothetical protein ALP29_201534 [Pseudomonas syringae pv. avii]|uniref:Uncharacterized protein n=1 Tax=Pseudomonas syringae pv. avii TaxID=663959 RepID=A0A3M5VCL3_PSESX|nr:hypothetical protein ALP29_201534 [Pseudomonas syringae pv. avii]